MSYVDGQLLPGEKVMYRARLHWITFLAPFCIGLVLLIPSIGLMVTGNAGLGLLLLALGAPWFGWPFINFHTSEFAVTNRRVIIKVGWIRRRTLETMLTKVEGIGVDQTVPGRMLGYGTITVTGTGGTREPFTNIANPLEFRRQVQAQVGHAEDAERPVGIPPHAAGVPGLVPARHERECPFCAERILTRARVCKHCGRAVEPLERA